MSSLELLLPGTAAGPISPPAMSAARVFIEKPPFFLSPVWQLPQCWRRIGTISWAKSMGSAAFARLEATRAPIAAAIINRQDCIMRLAIGSLVNLQSGQDPAHHQGH